MQAARKEEKDKLYPKIEELSKLVKEQQEYIREQKAKQEEDEKKAAETAEKRRLAKLSEEERELEARKKLEEQLREEREAREALEKRIADKERASQLEEYRKGALRAAGERIIPELVIGNSEEEIDDLNNYIKHDRDNLLTYAAMEQFRGKYLVQNRANKQIFETPQVAYMMIAATLFGRYPKDTRMQYVKDFYDATSTFDISLPTPIMAGVRTPQR